MVKNKKNIKKSKIYFYNILEIEITIKLRQIVYLIFSYLLDIFGG